MSDKTVDVKKPTPPGKRQRRVTSLADQVYEHLSTAIISGQLQSGERLVELEIAADMGTSQGPVREALQRLEHDGLVERRSHSATLVTTLAVDEIYELFSIRAVVERFAVRRALQNMTPDRCDELQELVNQMHAAGEADNIVALVKSDMTFHRRLCEWSGNTTLVRVWMPLYSQIQRFVAQTHPTYFPDLVELAETHQPIVDACRKGDADEAARILEDHIMLIWSRIEPSSKE